MAAYFTKKINQLPSGKPFHKMMTNTPPSCTPTPASHWLTTTVPETKAPCSSTSHKADVLDLFRPLPFNLNLSDLRQRQSRLFCLLPARCRIRLKHGFGSGGEVGIAINTLPEPTVLGESRTAILSMAMGIIKRLYLISKNGYL